MTTPGRLRLSIRPAQCLLDVRNRNGGHANMAATKSNRSSTAGQNKKKASAVQNAAKKIAGRERSSANPKPPRSVTQISQGRFPGETPLTGEGRRSNSAGG